MSEDFYKDNSMEKYPLDELIKKKKTSISISPCVWKEPYKSLRFEGTQVWIQTLRMRPFPGEKGVIFSHALLDTCILKQLSEVIWL